MTKHPGYWRRKRQYREVEAIIGDVAAYTMPVQQLFKDPLEGFSIDSDYDTEWDWEPPQADRSSSLADE